MTLAINTVDGHGLIVTKHFANYYRRRLSISHSFQAFYQLYNAKKTECLSYKSGHALQVSKFLKQDWPRVLQQLYH